MDILIALSILFGIIIFSLSATAYENKRTEREERNKKKQRWFDYASKFTESIPTLPHSILVALDKVADKMIGLTDETKFTLNPYDIHREYVNGGYIVIDSKGTPRYANFSVEDAAKDMQTLDELDCLHMQLYDGYELKNIVNEYITAAKNKELAEKKHAANVAAIDKYINERQ